MLPQNRQLATIRPHCSKYPYVEIFQRTIEPGVWLQRSFEEPDAVLEIGGCSMKLEEVYRRVKFEEVK